MVKYELLTEDYRNAPGGIKVYRIRALKDFGKVKKGELGGFTGHILVATKNRVSIGCWCGTYQI